MKFLLETLISTLSIIVVSYLMEPHVIVQGILTALVLALVLAALNYIVKPVLIILTLPVTILTLGLFMLVINTLIILIASSLVRGFWVENFWWAMLFSMALAFVTAVFRTLAEKKS
jgi:putative membrane protein